MSVVGTRTQIGVRETGGTVQVPGADTARLMYYLDCICTVVEVSGESDLRKLRDYQNYSRLTMDDEKKLLRLCVALNPGELTDKCIFKVPESTEGFRNKFLELNEARTTVLASNNVHIGGVSRKVTTIMMYKPSWMTCYYNEPIKSIDDKHKRLINATQSPRPQQQSIPQYGSQSLAEQLEKEKKQRWKSEGKLETERKQRLRSEGQLETERKQRLTSQEMLETERQQRLKSEGKLNTERKQRLRSEGQLEKERKQRLKSEQNLEAERQQRWKSEEKLDRLEQDNGNMRQELEDLRQQIARKKNKSKCTIL